MKRLLFLILLFPYILYGQTTVNLSPDSTINDLYVVGRSSTFTPADLTDLILWLDAAVGVTIDVGVETWEDQSTSGNDMTQTTDGFQPIFNADEYNSLPSVEGDGSDDWMDFTSDPTLSDFSLIVVERSPGYVLGNDASSVHYFSNNSTSAAIRMSDILTFITDADIVGWQLIEVYRTGSSVNTYKNGAASSSNPLTSSTNWLPRTLFRRTTSYSTARIGEIIICTSEVSSSEKTSVRNYLATKYGITIP